jgi:hypothetical protein
VDLWDLTKMMFRRWLVAVPVLLVSLGAVGWTAVSVEPDYSAKGYILLIPPRVSPDAAARAGRTLNPWTQLGGSELARAAAIKVGAQRVAEDLVNAGYGGFTVGQDGGSPGLTIEVAAEQAKYGVDTGDAFTTLVLADGTDVKQVNSKVKRAVIAVFGVGMIATVAVTAGVDALLRSRATRRRDRAPVEGQTQVSAETSRTQPIHANAFSKANGDVTLPVSVGSPASPSNGTTGSASTQAPPSVDGALSVQYQTAGQAGETAAAEANGSGQDDATSHAAPTPIDSTATIVLPQMLGRWPGREDGKPRH